MSLGKLGRRMIMFFFCVLLVSNGYSADRFISIEGKNGKCLDAEVMSFPSDDSLKIRTREGKFFTIKIDNIKKPSISDLAVHVGYVGASYFFGQNGYFKDRRKARSFLRFAHKHGDVSSSYIYGVLEGNYGNRYEAFYAFREAARHDHVEAQNKLGECFLYGRGCDKSYEKALKWFLRAEHGGSAWASFNLAEMMLSNGRDALFLEYLMRAAERFAAAGNRDGLALTAQKAEDAGCTSLAGQILAINVSESKRPQESYVGVASGTAWFCSPTILVTCHHVIANGVKLTLRVPDQKAEVPLEVVVSNPEFDLAVLRVKASSSFRASSFLAISKKRPYLGESIFTLGYPLPTLQGVAVKYTEGTISALSGFGDTETRVQHSAPIQPGNSGGPLLNRKGEVLGVVDSKIKQSLASSVNYAIKTPILLEMLERANCDFETEYSSAFEEPIVDYCQKAVFLILAYPTSE